MANEALARLVASLQSGGPADPTLEGRRAAFEALADSLLPLPEGTQSTPVDAGGVPAEWVTCGPPGGAPADAAVLYLHGGGFSHGSVKSHRALVARIARATQLRVLSIDYRLAPEHPYPAALDDSITAYRWLLAQGIPAKRLLVAGESAGGGLAFSLLVALRDRNLALPGAAFAISPWTDLSLSSPSLDHNAAHDPLVKKAGARVTVERYIGPDGDVHAPLVSPLFANLRGLPPLLIQVGLHECFLDDSLRFAARARRAGVDVTLDVWEDMIHIWPFFAKVLPEGEAAIDAIGAFVRHRLQVP